MPDAVLAPPPLTVNRASPPPPGMSGSAVRSGGPEIKLSQMTPAAPAAPAPPKQAESVRPPITTTPAVPIKDDGRKPSEKLFERLAAKGKDNNDRTAPEPPKAAAPAAPAEKPDEVVAEEGDELTAPAPVAAKPDEGKPGEVKAAPEVNEQKKKGVNPWHKIKEHEAALKQREAELEDLRKRIANPEAVKAEYERLSKIEARNKELEEHIKFVDYQKSSEFTEKFEKPYQAAWKRAMDDLGSLTIDDGAGKNRRIQPSDIMELVNMPLLKAKETAELVFGSAATDVMAYRKEIKGLFEQQAEALEGAKKSGQERTAKQTAEQAARMHEINEFSNREWENYNKSILENPQTGRYFKPEDGDEELNSRLDKGWQFVDETAKLNLSDPNLTKEQRAEAIRRHASVRARAAAFGSMRLRLERALKEAEGYKARLSEYEKSTPNLGGGGASIPASVAKGNNIGGLMERLAAKARK